VPTTQATVRAAQNVASGPETVSVLLDLMRPPAQKVLPNMLGPYHLIRSLGAGGMGRVFLAEHRAMRRPAALKVLSDEAAADPELLERFYREARALAVLDHPNIVRAYDVREAEGFHFLVLEYAPGQDLEALLRKRGPLPSTEAVGYIWQAAAGLGHAHGRGFIHRDVKPGNLLVDESGGVKLLDLGLARSNRPGDGTMTGEMDSGTIMCTPDYVAPEQARGEVPDARTDIYSLGITLYALLTGRAPFEGTVAQKLIAHQSRNPRRLHEVRPELPRGLSDVVARMIAKSPAKRYASMAEVSKALAPFKAGAPSAETARFAVTVPTKGATDWASITAEPDAKTWQAKRRPVWPVVLGAAVLGIIGLTISWVIRHAA
jgi:eukaryotic-like serine/threonine-protein kinase